MKVNQCSSLPIRRPFNFFVGSLCCCCRSSVSIYIPLCGSTTFLFHLHYSLLRHIHFFLSVSCVFVVAKYFTFTSSVIIFNKKITNKPKKV